MKKVFLLIVAVMICLGCAARNYEINVGEFSKLKVSDSINVVYKCVSSDSEESLRSGVVRFDCPSNFADACIFTNKNGTLRIQVHTDYINNPDLPTLYLYSDYMIGVENGGLGEVVIENPAPCADFSAKVIGNGSIVVKNLKASVCKAKIDTGCGSIAIDGSVKKSVLTLIGTGVIQTDRLEASEVVCKIMGGGSIGCWPIDLLSVSGVGSTKIYYKGEPLSIKKRGGGNLLKID